MIQCFVLFQIESLYFYNDTSTWDTCPRMPIFNTVFFEFLYITYNFFLCNVGVYYILDYTYTDIFAVYKIESNIRMFCYRVYAIWYLPICVLFFFI